MPIRYTSQSGLWTSPSTWQGGTVPQASDQVVIQAGHIVTYDVVEGSPQDVILGVSSSSIDVDIYGVLRFNSEATQPLRLRFNGYIQIRPGGQLIVGTSSNPMPVRVTIQKTSSGGNGVIVCSPGNPLPLISFSGTPNLPLTTDEWNETDYRLITFLAANASAGTNSIRVQHNLNWSVNDWIIIPRAHGYITTYNAPFVAQVTAVSPQPDGSVILTLSSTLPHTMVANRTPVAKINRSIVIIDPNSSSSFPSTISGEHVLATCRWVYFQRTGGNLLGAIDRPNSSAANQPIRIEYSSVHPLSTNGMIYREGTSAPPSSIVLYKCIDSAYMTQARVPITWEKSVYGNTSNNIYSPHQTIRRSYLFTPRFIGNPTGSITVKDSICYSPGNPENVSVTYENCTFYGTALRHQSNAVPYGFAIYKNCSFYLAHDGTTAPQLHWGDDANTSLIHYVFLDCAFYESWTEPSVFTNPGSIKGSYPNPLIRFINKRTATTTIGEQIYQAGGVITTDAAVKFNPRSFHSYRFEPRNLHFPLIYVVEVPRQVGYLVTSIQAYVNASIAPPPTSSIFAIVPQTELDTEVKFPLAWGRILQANGMWRETLAIAPIARPLKVLFHVSGLAGQAVWLAWEFRYAHLKGTLPFHINTSTGEMSLEWNNNYYRTNTIVLEADGEDKMLYFYLYDGANNPVTPTIAHLQVFNPSGSTEAIFNATITQNLCVFEIPSSFIGYLTRNVFYQARISVTTGQTQLMLPQYPIVLWKA